MSLGDIVMTKVTLTFEVDVELQAKLERLAEQSDRSTAQLLRDAAEDYVRRQGEAAADEARLECEIDEGLREANASDAQWIAQEDVMDGLRAKLAKRADIRK